MTNGAVELTPIFWQDGAGGAPRRGKLSVDDTMLNKSAVGLTSPWRIDHNGTTSGSKPR